MIKLKQLYKQITSQNGLFYLFLAVFILPNVLLSFTEPIPFAAKLFNVILPLGVYWLLFTLSKKPGITFFSLFLIAFLGAFQIVLLYLFGESIIAVDMFLNLVNTNSNEAFELLNNIWPGVLFVCIVYIPAIIEAIKSIRSKNKLTTSFIKQQRYIATGISALGVLLLILSYTTSKQPYVYEVRSELFPINVCYNAAQAFERKKEVNNYYETSSGFQFNASSTRIKDDKEIYIFVIGETARALNWELYGYNRPTNPLLKEMENLVVFPDAITESNTTHKSVPLLLSSASAQNYSALYKQKSIITAFKEAGFETFYCTNQSSNKSYIDFFANEADETIRLKDGLSPKINVYDSELSVKVKQRLAKGYNKLLIVLHSYGSHFDYHARYPQDYVYFTPDKETRATPKLRPFLINEYDNTIRYTDAFLADLMQTLEQENVPSALLYTSDHGEDIFDDNRNRFLHASPVPSYYQLHVPFLIWMSSDYKNQFGELFSTIEKNKENPISTNLVSFHTLLSLAGIETPYLELNYSLGSDKYSIDKRYYLNDHCKPETLKQIGLKKADFLMFDKMHLQYSKE